MAQVDVTGLETAMAAFADALRATNSAESARVAAADKLAAAQTALEAAQGAEGDSEVAVSTAAADLKSAIDSAVVAIAN